MDHFNDRNEFLKLSPERDKTYSLAVLQMCGNLHRVKASYRGAILRVAPDGVAEVAYQRLLTRGRTAWCPFGYPVTALAHDRRK